MKKVAVGSKNPVKIEAVRIAFEKVWPNEEWLVEGLEVESGVSSQPMSDEETIKGARIRALKILQNVKADFAVGIEGGLHKVENRWFDTGWIVVIDKNEKEGVGSTIRAHVSDDIMKIVHKGIDLGDACNTVFKRKDTGITNGHYGLITKDLITRTSGYVDGVIIALSSLAHPKFFDK